jgi:hypothetical protein
MTTYTAPTAEQSRADWIAWLAGYGADKFYDAFIETAQGAISECVNCGEAIALDIVEGGGVPDWGNDGDYGCWASPDTGDDGTGSHEPTR